MSKLVLVTALILGAAAAAVAGFLLAPSFFDAQPAAPAPTSSVSQPSTVVPGAEGQVVIDSIGAAQDAEAKDDIAQVSIYQAASLTLVGVVQTSLESATDASGAPVDVGVDVATRSVLVIAVTPDRMHYVVVVASESGRFFGRLDGGEIVGADRQLNTPTRSTRCSG